MSTPKLESDRSIATMSTFLNDLNCAVFIPQQSFDDNYDLHFISILGIGVSAHFFIMLFGL